MFERDMSIGRWSRFIDIPLNAHFEAPTSFQRVGTKSYRFVLSFIKKFQATIYIKCSRVRSNYTNDNCQALVDYL